MESEEELLARLNKDTAYKIRRARERDGIVCECCDPRDPAVLNRFEEFYNAFAATKGLAPLERSAVESMVAAGVLDLSLAKDSEGRPLVYHANYRASHRARELYLPSLPRNASDNAIRNVISRASRYLTWSDMLRYKADGLKLFDFGGWYPGTADESLLRINEFKRGFGGEVIREYECEQILTLRGWAALRGAEFLKRAKLFRSALKKADRTAELPVHGVVRAPAA